MQIECATTIAAADVLSILINAYLRPGREFHITDPHPPGTPVHVTLSVNLPAHVLYRVQDIPDVLIAGEHAAWPHRRHTTPGAIRGRFR